MADVTKIQWAHHTWNPWRGCAHAKLADGSEHPGCQHCYAEAMSGRNPAVLGEWGEDGVRAIGSESYWQAPKRWNRDAEAAGERRRVFCASLADVFEDRVELVTLRKRVFEMIDRCPWLDFLVLTKRPQNVRAMWNDLDDRPAGVLQRYRPNVWLGTSISDQRTADELLPLLMMSRELVPVLFASYEPALGPVSLSAFTPIGSSDPSAFRDLVPCLDWVIFGGESGVQARRCEVAWIRAGLQECQAGEVAAFVKQLGSESIWRQSEWNSAQLGASPQFVVASLSDSKGGDPAEWPEDLRVREFPNVAVIAPRDELNDQATSEKRSVHHAERDGYVGEVLA